MKTRLGRIRVRRKTGREHFHAGGKPRRFCLLDFWRWSGSDLISNTARGILAEFLVAKALRLPTREARKPWGAVDLRSPHGLKIEVKSAAYLQSWPQDRFSTIQFGIAKRINYDPAPGEVGERLRRRAHIYVFAILDHKDKQTVDPQDLEQWKFFVVATEVLNRRRRSQHSITLASLVDLHGEGCDFVGLRRRVNEVIRKYRLPKL